MERAELARLLGGQGVAGNREPVCVSEAQPEKFMKAFAAAVAGEGEVFLGDPSWGRAEREQLALLLRARREPEKTVAGHSRGTFGWLMIPTGGSGGRLKFARHDEKTIEAAVRGFTRHLGLERVNACGLLPLHHVSGLMAWMRCVWSGGEYRHCDWKTIGSGELPELPAKREGWVVSLVPTQLERLLKNDAAVKWLSGFRIIFLGGAPAAPALLDKAAALGLRISLGYGMTETAAMVTALLPEEFLSGRRDSGRALPHASVRIGEDGLVRIGGGSLFRGYYPAWREGEEFVTADLGRIDEAGHLTVLGRADGVIITGGEKVLPSEVESVLRGSGQFNEVVVVGVPDAEWGQAVVAVYPSGDSPDLKKVDQVIISHLSAWKRPKRYVALANWPRTAAGKVNRAEVGRRLQGR